MSEFLVGALKIAYLGMLWVFILFAARIIRTDLFGRTVTAGEVAASSMKPRRRKAGRRTPTALVVVEGRQAGLHIPLAGTVGIGRSADAALNIDDDYASTRHAVLRQDDAGRWYVEDLNSTNGTSVNATRIVGPTAVQTGDVIRIGRTVMRLERS